MAFEVNKFKFILLFCLVSLFSFFKLSNSSKSTSEIHFKSNFASELMLLKIMFNNFFFSFLLYLFTLFGNMILNISFINFIFSLVSISSFCFLITFLIFLTNFWAWERIWVLVLVLIKNCMFFHWFPYFKIPSINFSCSSLVHAPSLYLFSSISLILMELFNWISDVEILFSVEEIFLEYIFGACFGLLFFKIPGEIVFAPREIFINECSGVFICSEILGWINWVESFSPLLL